MKPNKRRKRLQQQRAGSAPSSLRVSDIACDVCGTPGTRPVGCGETRTEIPLCWSCVVLLAEAALHAADNGGTPAQADRFAWKHLREERGKQATR